MIQPKFNIGDKVYFSSADQRGNIIQCPDCLGSTEWKVTTPEGKEFQTNCGTCSQGYHSTGTVKEWCCTPSARCLTIGSIRIDTADTNKPISYMCIETGVGSGSVYYEDKLFLTEKDAIDAATVEAETTQEERDAQTLTRLRDANKRKNYYKPRLDDSEGRQLFAIIRRLESKIEKLEGSK